MEAGYRVRGALVARLRGGLTTDRLAFPGWLPPPLHGLLPVLIGALWALSIRDVPLREMSDLGLVSVLPGLTTLLLFALTASFCVSLGRQPPGTIVPLVHVLVLIVVLYGVTAFLEPDPRFGTVWKHVGIMDYIGRNHAVDPGIDAYFSWPGFFTFGAFLTDVAGLDSPLTLGAWGPLAFNLLYLAPLVVLFRWASDDPRVLWGGLWAFYSTNWVAQDYIAPQAMGFLLWLVMLGALLTTFTPRPAVLEGPLTPHVVLRSMHPRALLARIKERPSDAGSAMSGGRVALLLVVLLMYTATVTGHQLTPVPALLTVSGLALLAGLETRRLPVIMAVLLGAWISYMTTQYLIGNIGTLAEPVGSVGGNVNQNVTGRLKGSPEHQLIVQGRLVASAAIWALAFLGLVRRLRAGHADVAFVLIGAAPFLLPVLQPYGGEILLRVFLFSLPVVAFFIATAAFPSPSAGRDWATLAVAALVGCLLLWAFQYTRYGNERVDHFTSGDVATVEALYRIAPKGSVLFAGARNLPWQHRDYASYDYRSITDLAAWREEVRPKPRRLAAEVREKLERKPGYVVVTRSTRISASLLSGKPGALEGLVRTLRTLPAARQVYRGRDGDVFKVQPRTRGRRTAGAASE